MNQIFNLYIPQAMPIFYTAFPKNILPNQFTYTINICIVRYVIRLKAERETEHAEKWNAINNQNYSRSENYKPNKWHLDSNNQ